MNEPAASFEQVLMLDVLEHIRNELAALAQVNMLLVMNGRLIITVLNRDFEWRRETQLNFLDRQAKLRGSERAFCFASQRAERREWCFGLVLVV